MTAKHPAVRRVLDVAGRTYCEQAGFRLRNTPSALYQLLVLSTLLAKPISAELAVAAARELRRAGYRTPRRMLESSWQQRVDALGRGHYRRYDESTATILDKQARALLAGYRGDLRRLAEAAGHDADRAGELLRELPGLGPAAAQIFLREAQRVWHWLVPYVDDRTVDGAARLGFPHTKADVRRVLSRSGDPAGLAAAFVRATVDGDVLDKLRAAS